MLEYLLCKEDICNIIVIYSCVLINAQQVEDAASKVQAAAKGGSTTEDDELSDDDDEMSSLVRTSLEMEYVTAIDSVDTAVDEFYTFKTTLESESLSNVTVIHGNF